MTNGLRMLHPKDYEVEVDVWQFQNETLMDCWVDIQMLAMEDGECPDCMKLLNSIP